MDYLCTSLTLHFKGFNIVITAHEEARFLTDFYIYVHSCGNLTLHLAK